MFSRLLLRGLLRSLLGGLHAFLAVIHEGGEEALVRPGPCSGEILVVFLLRASAFGEDFRGSGVLLGLVLQSLRAVGHPTLNEVDVALLKLHQARSTRPPVLSRFGVVLLKLHELQPILRHLHAVALERREVLRDRLLSIPLSLGYLAHRTRHPVNVLAVDHSHRLRADGFLYVPNAHISIQARSQTFVVESLVSCFTPRNLE